MEQKPLFPKIVVYENLVGSARYVKFYLWTFYFLYFVYIISSKFLKLKTCLKITSWTKIKVLVTLKESDVIKEHYIIHILCTIFLQISIVKSSDSCYCSSHVFLFLFFFNILEFLPYSKLPLWLFFIVLPIFISKQC